MDSNLWIRLKSPKCILVDLFSLGKNVFLTILLCRMGIEHEGMEESHHKDTMF